MMRTNLRRLWYYRPWHRVKAIYHEDQVERAAFEASVFEGTFVCLVLMALHAGARWCGSAQGRCGFMLVDANCPEPE